MEEHDVNRICDSVSSVIAPILLNKFKVSHVNELKEKEGNDSSLVMEHSKRFYDCFSDMLRTKYSNELEAMLENPESFELSSSSRDSKNERYGPLDCDVERQNEKSETKRTKPCIIPTRETLHKIKSRFGIMTTTLTKVQRRLENRAERIVNKLAASRQDLSKETVILKEESCHILCDFIAITNDIGWKHCKVRLESHFSGHHITFCFLENMKVGAYQIKLKRIKLIRQTIINEADSDSIISLTLRSGREVFVGFESFTTMRSWMKTLHEVSSVVDAEHLWQDGDSQSSSYQPNP